MSNISKALELLQLPDECGQFEGQIQTKTDRHIIVHEIHDFTVSPRKVTTEIKVGETTQLFGAYTLNLLLAYLHSYNHEVEVIEEGLFKSFKERKTVGQYWYPWQRVEITPSAVGHSFDVITDIGLNSTYSPSGGVPTDPNNPQVRAGVFYRQQTSITKSNGVTKTYTGKKQYVKWTVSQLVAATGMSEMEIAEATRSTFNSVTVNPETHMTSIAMDIEKIGENQVKGVFHINGVPVTGSPQKITSYNKVCPSFVFRWNLYNKPGVNAYGSSVMKQFTAAEDNTITFVAGNTDAYNAETKTLTYDESLTTPATLVAYAEFLPAQGKNENAGRTLVLETGLEDIWG